ncbi:MAG: hypothetical protein GAK38_03410 [Xylophilus sp.]|nr:MAG: hypothetical protein GAK38_03410 [Xylophilus sp.]
MEWRVWGIAGVVGAAALAMIAGAVDYCCASETS